ncbi:hypothetical protein [Mycobacterium sp. 852002-40037_SCH5390672]|uniref:hypothetical protein n=1 Tax=Mycobacterium sp. 852002-40037_SCH5390672 TaxID=1834089 RepID=UPI000804B57B|nr:hypothetical protein [Mycobacterium sp. 852002-40037_SCH5390672]OBB90035.1 hypothetical protein A5782_17035 [Mycobacterium sp. 852002-40037_SCH5390672]
MAIRRANMIFAACAGAAVFSVTLGYVGDADAPRTNADPSPTVAPTTVEPTPTSPDDDYCCDTAQPQAGRWDCKIGLNCGPIRPRRTWPPPAPPPPNPPQ